MKDVSKKRHNILYTTSFNHMNKKLFHPVVLCPEKGELAEKMRDAGADVIYLEMENEHVLGLIHLIITSSKST